MTSLTRLADRASSLIEGRDSARDPFGLMILSLDQTLGLDALSPAEREDVVGAAASRVAGRMRRGDLIARFDDTSLALLREGGDASDMKVAFARFAKPSPISPSPRRRAR